MFDLYEDGVLKGTYSIDRMMTEHRAIFQNYGYTMRDLQDMTIGEEIITGSIGWVKVGA